MPNVGSRKASGSGVPHFWSTNWRVLTNTPSAGTGVSPPVPRPIRLARIGMLEVVMVWRPGPSTSRARPSRKKTAAWLSRTITCEPSRKSPGPPWGSRWTISRPESSKNSTTSMMRGICFSLAAYRRRRCGDRLWGIGRDEERSAAVRAFHDALPHQLAHAAAVGTCVAAHARRVLRVKGLRIPVDVAGKEALVDEFVHRRRDVVARHLHFDHRLAQWYLALCLDHAEQPLFLAHLYQLTRFGPALHVQIGADTAEQQQGQDAEQRNAQDRARGLHLMRRQAGANKHCRHDKNDDPNQHQDQADRFPACTHTLLAESTAPTAASPAGLRYMGAPAIAVGTARGVIAIRPIPPWRRGVDGGKCLDPALFEAEGDRIGQVALELVRGLIDLCIAVDVREIAPEGAPPGHGGRPLGRAFRHERARHDHPEGHEADGNRHQHRERRDL